MRTNQLEQEMWVSFGNKTNLIKHFGLHREVAAGEAGVRTVAPSFSWGERAN
jgi:hypothetical protein